MSKPAQVCPNKSTWLKCGIKFCCPGLCLVSLNLWTRSRDGCGVIWRPFKHNISCLTCTRWVQSTLGGFTGWLLTRLPLPGIGVNGDVIRMCIPASGINTCGKNSSWSTVSNSISLSPGSCRRFWLHPRPCIKSWDGTAASRITTILSTCHLTHCLAGVSPSGSGDILHRKKAIKWTVAGLLNSPIFKGPCSVPQHIHISGRHHGEPHICSLLHCWESKLRSPRDAFWRPEGTEPS